MNSTPPITQDPPVQHQLSTSPTRKGNSRLKNSKRQSKKKAGKGAQWDKWQKHMTEPEPQKGKWGAPSPSTGTIFKYSRTQPGTINILQHGDPIIEDTTGKFTEVCKHINAHSEEFFAFCQAEFKKDFDNDESNTESLSVSSWVLRPPFFLFFFRSRISSSYFRVMRSNIGTYAILN